MRRSSLTEILRFVPDYLGAHILIVCMCGLLPGGAGGGIKNGSCEIHP